MPIDATAADHAIKDSGDRKQLYPSGMAGLPFSPFFAESIGDDDEFARDGRDDDLVRLACFAEPIGESSEGRVVM